MNAKTLTNREIVTECMHSDGKLRGLITWQTWVEAYLLCDGFGAICFGQANNQCFDWSHVRDSTEDGLAKAAHLLTKSL